MDEFDIGHRVPIVCRRSVSTFRESAPIGMSLTRTAWIKLNGVRTYVGRFGSSMHKWGFALSAKCECGASEQTADHVIFTCPTHRAPREIMGLTVLDDETRCWLNSITASI